MAFLPAIIPYITAIASVASTAVSIIGSLSSSSASEEAEQTQAQMARDNAEQARIAAQQRESDFRKKSAQALSMETAARGASGVAQAGSPLLTYYENAKSYEEDAMRIRAGGEAEVKGWLQKAELHEDYASAAESEGMTKGVGTLLTGAGEFFTSSTKSGLF